MHRFLLTLVAVASVVCIGAGVYYPWFEVPVAGDRVVDPTAIMSQSSTWMVAFQWSTIALTLLTMGIAILAPKRRRAAAAMVAVGFVFVLLFPLYQLIWQPSLMARASWLQIQHENITWFGGDLFRGQELESTPGQMRVYLSDTPRHISVASLPEWSLDALGLHQLPNLLEWLGYSNTFCQFVAVGWPMSVVGISLLLLTMLFENNRVVIGRLKTCIQVSMICGAAGVLTAWHYPFRASLALSRAADATHRGEHSAALQQLESAARIWPPLEQDTWFIAQTGLTESLLQRSSPCTRLYMARSLEKARRYDEAMSTMRALATSVEPESPIRREACRGILRHAIRALNSGECAKAVDGLRFVLDLEPCNLKSLYALQVACRQNGDLSTCQTAHDQLVNVYRHMHFPNAKIVIGKSRAMLDRRFPQRFATEESDTTEKSIKQEGSGTFFGTNTASLRNDPEAEKGT